MFVGYLVWVKHPSLDCNKIQPVHPKGDESWVFIGKTDAKAETPILWPPHGKSWLIGKDSDAGRDWGQDKKGTTEDEMAGWHHRLDGHEFEWTPGVGDGQGGLVSCDSWGRKESDMTERLNWTEAPYKWLETSHKATCGPCSHKAFNHMIQQMRTNKCIILNYNGCFYIWICKFINALGGTSKRMKSFYFLKKKFIKI